MAEVTVTGLVRDEGTVVVFSGTTEDDLGVTFACDHRCAQAIVDALEAGEEPVAVVEDYLILGTYFPSS